MRYRALRTLALIAVWLLAGAPAFAQLPDLYRSVTGVHWVVADLDKVKQGWARLGFPALQDHGEVGLQMVHRGRSTTSRLRVAMASLGGLEVHWIQPLDANGAYAEFLARHGSGIMSLNHTAPSLDALEKEVARLNAAGIPVLQRADVDTGGGLLTVVHMDTEAEGKYVLGLVHGSVPGAGAPPPTPFGLKRSQFAFLAKDLKGVGEFWKKAGFPEMSVTHGPLRDLVYRGQPGQFDQELGWQRHGQIVYEWIRILKGPTVYEEYLKAHGEGAHHLGFDVADMDKVIGEWSALGFPPLQSGAWGEKGKPGSGRFAYLDTEGIGGVLIELLWHQD